jgi:hypothetical protein
MRFHLLAICLAAHDAIVKWRVFGAMGHVDHAVGHAARHAVVLRMLLAAASLADYRCRVAALAPAGSPLHRLFLATPVCVDMSASGLEAGTGRLFFSPPLGCPTSPAVPRMLR